MLIHLFYHRYNDCRQLLDFSWKEKRNTKGSKEQEKGNRAHYVNCNIAFDITGQQIFRHHTGHTHECRVYVCYVTQASCPVDS